MEMFITLLLLAGIVNSNTGNTPMSQEQELLEKYKGYLANPKIKNIAEIVQVMRDAKRHAMEVAAMEAAATASTTSETPEDDANKQSDANNRNQRSRVSDDKKNGMPKKYSDITDRNEMMDETVDVCRNAYIFNGDKPIAKKDSAEYGKVPSAICFLMKNYKTALPCNSEHNCTQLLESTEQRTAFLKKLGIEHAKIRIIPELENAEEIYLALENSGIASKYETSDDMDSLKLRKPIQIRTFRPVIHSVTAKLNVHDGFLELNVKASLKGFNIDKVAATT